MILLHSYPKKSCVFGETGTVFPNVTYSLGCFPLPLLLVISFQMQRVHTTYSTDCDTALTHYQGSFCLDCTG